MRSSVASGPAGNLRTVEDMVLPRRTPELIAGIVVRTNSAGDGGDSVKRGSRATSSATAFMDRRVKPFTGRCIPFVVRERGDTLPASSSEHRRLSDSTFCDRSKTLVTSASWNSNT